MPETPTTSVPSPTSEHHLDAAPSPPLKKGKHGSNHAQRKTSILDLPEIVLQIIFLFALTPLKDKSIGYLDANVVQFMRGEFLSNNSNAMQSLALVCTYFSQIVRNAIPAVESWPNSCGLCFCPEMECIKFSARCDMRDEILGKFLAQCYRLKSLGFDLFSSCTHIGDMAANIPSSLLALSVTHLQLRLEMVYSSRNNASLLPLRPEIFRCANTAKATELIHSVAHTLTHLRLRFLCEEDVDFRPWLTLTASRLREVRIDLEPDNFLTIEPESCIVPDSLPDSLESVTVVMWYNVMTLPREIRALCARLRERLLEIPRSNGRPLTVKVEEELHPEPSTPPGDYSDDIGSDSEESAEE